MSFGGKLLKLSHDSPITKTKMNVNIYFPKQYFDSTSTESKIPVLLYLAGLTCDPNNGSEKAFFQPYADKYGFAVVYPDTSPRGVGNPGEDDSWEFGTAAGFYVDAETKPWNNNYKMYSYILKDLLPSVGKAYTKLDLTRVSVTGHSMGGYGALMFFLKNPGFFKSVSAFAPICNPSEVPWGFTNFGGYLGDDKSKWLEYDPVHLIKKYDGPKSTILYHVGTKDGFEVDQHQLRPETLVEASKGTVLDGYVEYKSVKDFDHSYYFVASFAGEHSAHHAKYLGLTSSKL
ncbi:unnamed protein product [Ambrosiozyma monospora]|uniref:S-formylglutathione hydrolase n=1 Tax=Ambrosiozyma monospora TaxID=43982 RepID=A0A9W6Z1S5_AMBMO|nr:unnamed protein product [Ambrosiozyma monospora]